MYQLAPDHLTLPSDGELDAARVSLVTQGHVVLPDVVRAPLLAALRDEADRLTRTLDGHEDGTFIARDHMGRVLSMHNLDRHSDLLFDIIRLPAFLQAAERLLESRCVPFLIEYFAKPAEKSEPTPAHQDQIFYRDHFGDEQAVTFWVALSDVTEADGVLQYATAQPEPGRLLRHRVSEVHNFGAELVAPEEFAFRSAPVPAGGAVVHHSYAVHRSGPMLGLRPRTAFALNYRRSPYRQHKDPLVIR